MPVSFISLRLERVDNLGAYRIPSETGILIPSDFVSYEFLVVISAYQRANVFFSRADMSETLQEIINKLWIAPDNAEWTPKTDTVQLGDVRRWLKSDDIEILGFTNALIDDAHSVNLIWPTLII